MKIWSPNKVSRKGWLWLAILGAILSFTIIGGNAWASEAASGEVHEFPLSLESYGDDNLDGIGAKIRNRIELEPFNFIATLIFLCAIIHTFMASKFMSIAGMRTQRRSGQAKQETVLRIFSLRRRTSSARLKSSSVCGWCHSSWPSCTSTIGPP